MKPVSSTSLGFCACSRINANLFLDYIKTGGRRVEGTTDTRNTGPRTQPQTTVHILTCARCLWFSIGIQSLGIRKWSGTFELSICSRTPKLYTRPELFAPFFFRHKMSLGRMQANTVRLPRTRTKILCRQKLKQVSSKKALNGASRHFDWKSIINSYFKRLCFSVVVSRCLDRHARFLSLLFFRFGNDRSFVFRLTGCLHTAIFADTMEAPYLRITPGHYANIGENDTLYKDREPPKTIRGTYLYSPCRGFPPLPGGAKIPLITAHNSKTVRLNIPSELR